MEIQQLVNGREGDEPASVSVQTHFSLLGARQSLDPPNIVTQTKRPRSPNESLEIQQGAPGKKRINRLPGACVRCKTLKSKCEFNEGSDVCKRCLNGGHECIVLGRKRPRVPPKREHLINQIRVQADQINNLLAQLEEIQQPKGQQFSGSDKPSAAPQHPVAYGDSSDTCDVSPTAGPSPDSNATMNGWLLQVLKNYPHLNTAAAAGVFGQLNEQANMMASLQGQLNMLDTPDDSGEVDEQELRPQMRIEPPLTAHSPVHFVPNPIGPDWSKFRPLILELIENAHLVTAVAKLEGEDAQAMVDFLNVVLHENDVLSNGERKRTLNLLSQLSRSVQLFPRCYELKGVEFSGGPREGGGFADIYKGNYKNSDICVKVLRVFGKGDNTQLLRNNVRELILWAHLTHQNILPFYGAYLLGSTPNRICLVSPWMENGDLLSYLRAFPQIPRMPLISDVVSGLVYLHDSNIAHGDLKAKNILVSACGRALIADFGVSRIAMTTMQTSLHTTTTQCNGTLRWTAPELLADASRPPTREADVWSLGCVIYEIFTLKIPFYQYGRDYQVYTVVVVDRKIPKRPETDAESETVDDATWALMTKCWTHEPQDRPSCKDIERDIAALQIVDDRSSVSASPEDNSAFWKAMKAESKDHINYERIFQIMTRINELQETINAVVDDN